MRSSGSRRVGLVLVLLGACAGDLREPARTRPPPLLEFAGVVDPAARLFQITAVGATSRGLDGLGEFGRLAVEQDGLPNHGTPGHVELVTTRVGECHGPDSFGGDVTINGFFAHLTPIHLVALVVDLTPVTSAQPFGADSLPPFDNALGLWIHGDSGASRTWCYDVLTGTRFHFRGQVFGELVPKGKFIGLGLGRHGRSYPDAVEISEADLALGDGQDEFANLYNSLGGLVNLEPGFASGSCCLRAADHGPGVSWTFRPSAPASGVVVPVGLDGAESCGVHPGPMAKLALPSGLLEPPLDASAIFGGEPASGETLCPERGLPPPALFWLR